MAKKIIAFVVFVVAFFVVWNICDFLFTTFISRGTFEFTVFGDAILPTVVAIVVGGIVVFAKNKKQDDTKNE